MEEVTLGHAFLPTTQNPADHPTYGGGSQRCSLLHFAACSMIPVLHSEDLPPCSWRRFLYRTCVRVRRHA
jgi:hypothetical protein